jgi:hypothetical protein
LEAGKLKQDVFAKNSGVFKLVLVKSRVEINILCRRIIGMSKSDKNNKLNCWEFKKCGRELGGEKAKELGVCPAAKERRLDGSHDGTNAGRACWIVAGTFCEGEIQGTFAKKYDNCSVCEFYESVRKEEFAKFIPAAILSLKLD